MSGLKCSCQTLPFAYTNKFVYYKYIKAIPIKCFVSYRLANPFFQRVKKKKKIPDSLVKEANTLIYKHTTLFSFRNLITSAQELLFAIVE